MKAVIIGSGNVATHLSLALQAKGIVISQIYSRTASNAQVLADKLQTAYTTDIAQIDTEADIYFYALKDDAFIQFIHNFKLPDAIHVHTAGSISITEFEGLTANYGVFYPLQTFSKSRAVDFSQIPICLEWSNAEVEKTLHSLAQLISTKIFTIDSEQRQKLHLAAVFACNFTNYLYDAAAMILEDAHISFDIIKPLIAETAAKIQTLSPKSAQTGPAVRYDQNVIDKHLNSLADNVELKQIYQLLSENIHQRHKK